MSTALPAELDLNEAIRLHDYVADVVRQSAACHPDWTIETHLAYLAGEEEIDLDATVAWLRPLTGWRTATVRGLAGAIVGAL